jgi:hypothetical protein
MKLIQKNAPVKGAVSANATLTSKWRKVLNHPSYKPIQEGKKAAVAKMLENLYLRGRGMLKEEKLTTADIEGYNTMLIPMIRRMAPELIAMDLVGTQPMEKPSQLIFALRAFYSGATQDSTDFSIAGGWKGNGTMAVVAQLFGTEENLTQLDEIKTRKPSWSTSTFAALAAGSGSTYGVVKSAANAVSDLTLYSVPVVLDSGTGAFSGYSGSGSGCSYECTAIGTVKYAENGGLVVLLDSGAGVSKDDYLTFDSTFGFDSGDTPDDVATNLFQAKKVIANEVLYNHVFKHYSGSYTTAEAEAMKTFNELSFDIESDTVTAKSRLLKARFTFESAEDLKAYFGNEAEPELLNMMTYEILAEMNREMRDTIVNAALNTANNAYVFDYSAIASTEGRNFNEKYRILYNLINRLASSIAISTRRGSGNWLIMSLPVKDALESLEGFALWTDVNNNFNANAAVAYAGTLAGRYKVYVDTFATEDYVAVGYKGDSQLDSGIFWCPYVPLTAVKSVDPENMQPRLGFRTRYGIGANPLGSHLYYRYCSVQNLSNSFGVDGVEII